jgi:hypothetical protein
MNADGSGETPDSGRDMMEEPFFSSDGKMIVYRAFTTDTREIESTKKNIA